ncbi:DUF695 domain-containing protein [Paenibacillus athensensis]|uniref:DUF695 domain-containing protein n=1 Tax=Paenibacillus athensensis TaxID=1967502 RepID=A0A4Y8PQD7_9BACL|nr:DUF695 domain-containing protein [Paenibacillus athensensis]MCD1259280.1 DUF695 domain-containing protein [Paenibacillus athensensis]
MPEDWNLFERKLGGETMMIFMNTALKDRAPIAGFSQMIAVVFNMYSLWDACGHSSKSAQELFYKLEERLMRRSKEADLAVYAGRISLDSRMELIFYAREGEELEERLQAVMADFPQFRWYTSAREDEAWSFYLQDMYPSRLEEQWMRNAKIAFALHRHGDRADVVREVEHWLHFAEADQRDEAANRALATGYEVSASTMDASRSAMPYVLQLTKRHALDLATVNEVTKELYTLAAEAGGAYDGWGTRLKLRRLARMRNMLRLWWARKVVRAGVVALLATIAGFVVWFLT